MLGGCAKAASFWRSVSLHVGQTSAADEVSAVRGRDRVPCSGLLNRVVSHSEEGRRFVLQQSWQTPRHVSPRPTALLEARGASAN